MPRWLAMALTHQVRRLGAACQARRHDRRQRPRLRQHELGGRSPAPSLRPHLGVAPTLVPARAEARCARQPGRPAVPGAVSVYAYRPRDAYGARGTDTVVGARPSVILRIGVGVAVSALPPRRISTPRTSSRCWVIQTWLSAFIFHSVGNLSKPVSICLSLCLSASGLREQGLSIKSARRRHQGAIIRLVRRRPGPTHPSAF